MVRKHKETIRVINHFMGSASEWKLQIIIKAKINLLSLSTRSLRLSPMFFFLILPPSMEAGRFMDRL